MISLFKKAVVWLSAERFYRLAGYCLPWAGFICLLCLSVGLVGGLFIVPADYQQGDAFRMIYIHVPAAFCSLMIYSLMAMAAAIAIIYRIKVYQTLVVVLPAIGAAFTALALITGSLWGKPMWGTWWIWDARLTSELILLFLYLGIIALGQAIPQRDKAVQAMCILTLLGFVDIPIIHYSVNWWQTLHQGATLRLLSKPSIDSSMLWPLLFMMAGFISYTVWLVCLKSRTYLLHSHAQTRWALAMQQAGSQ